MIKVGFICVHNSCRSQIAEALGKRYGKDIFESYSGGTALKDRINSDAVEVMKELYGIDMEETQKSKLLEDIPDLDIVIKMGCNVVCPIVKGKYIEDWGIEDPTGRDREEFVKTVQIIEVKIKELISRINNNEF